MGYAYSILGDFHLAQDAAQEAFVEAHSRLGQLRKPDAFPGWLRRIVFKQCDRLIRQKRVPTVPMEFVALPAADTAPADQILEEQEMKDEVLAMINALPEKERMATTLFYISGYSQSEVAEFLEVPVTTVKSRLHSSRKKLKEQMMNKVDETLKSFPLPDRFADVILQMNFVVEQVNPLAEQLRELSAEGMVNRSHDLRQRLTEGENRDAIKAEAFALVREASRRAHGWPHYDVQLAASMILDEGWVAESTVGEGKTITCFPAIYMAVLEGRKVHIVTVNDYLARRDSDIAEQVFTLLGVSVACVTADMPISGDRKDRAEAYRMDITYATYMELAFDHLMDEWRDDAPLHSSLDMAILDEVDSVLVDEAAIEILIHGDETGPIPDCDQIPNLQRDRDYLVDGGRIHVIDPHVGRLRTNLRFPDGIQQAVEARERLGQTPAHRPLASTTLRDFFKKYDKLAGLAGTASSKAATLKTDYGLCVTRIPTRQQSNRVDHKDQVFPDADSRNDALIAEVLHYSHDLRRPVLVACTGLEASEAVSHLLADKGIEHQLLNARPENAAHEADIVTNAGSQRSAKDGRTVGMVTVSTSMAGRGTDIRVDPKGVPCGLHVIGVGRHADRSIDDQLCLRAGRQGQPGSTRFLVSKDEEAFVSEATYCIERHVS